MYALTETGGFAADAEVTGLATPLVDGLGRPDLVRDRACVDRRRLARRGRRPAARGHRASERTLPDWRATPAEERDAILRRWAGLMPRREGDLARAMALQQDKSLAELRGEIDYTASFLHRFREEAKRLWGKTIPSHLSGSPLTVVPAV